MALPDFRFYAVQGKVVEGAGVRAQMYEWVIDTGTHKQLFSSFDDAIETLKKWTEIYR